MSLFRISPRTIVLGGIAIAAAAGVLKNRDRVAGLIGARSSAPEPPRPEPAAAPAAPPEAPAPSNYDVGGPAANTATAVPAPDALGLDEDGGIDERAEEEAAAAEAAAIGGGVPEYAGLTMDEPADEALRPLMEAGEGESEGLEQAEADLVDEAEAPFVHPDQTSLLGEEEEEPARETPAAEKSSAVWQPPTASAGDDEQREGDSGWQTWSGRPPE